MLNELQKEAEKKMSKAIDALNHDLSKLRTGRANTSILDQIKVDYYGTLTPLNQVSSIVVSDSRTLTVTPWEKNLLKDIEKAIMNSDLGLNPMSVGNLLKVPMPPLTEERRKELIKVVKSEAENSRVAVRKIRRDFNNQLKDMIKDKAITEDEERKGSTIIQSVTDEHIKKIDKVIENKESDLLEV